MKEPIVRMMKLTSLSAALCIYRLLIMGVTPSRSEFDGLQNIEKATAMVS